MGTPDQLVPKGASSVLSFMEKHSVFERMELRLKGVLNIGSGGLELVR